MGKSAGECGYRCGYLLRMAVKQEVLKHRLETAEKRKEVNVKETGIQEAAGIQGGNTAAGNTENRTQKKRITSGLEITVKALGADEEENTLYSRGMKQEPPITTYPL